MEAQKEPVRKTMRRPYEPSGANRNDDDEDSVEQLKFLKNRNGGLRVSA